MNFKVVAKPTTRTFAPGTLDKADAHNERVTFGVSCSVWKGSSGGPCVVMDGDAAGGIMGLGTIRFCVLDVSDRVPLTSLVRGHEVVEGPYNAVNGFPLGLKNIIKHIDYRY